MAMLSWGALFLALGCGCGSGDGGGGADAAMADGAPSTGPHCVGDGGIARAEIHQNGVVRFSVTDIAPGAYDLEARTLNDSCSPAGLTGDFDVAVRCGSQPATVRVTVPNDIALTQPGITGVSFTGLERFDESLAASYSTPIVLCEGTMERTMEIDSAVPGEFRMMIVDCWKGQSGCAETATAPRSICCSRRRFIYRLRIPCAPPCGLRVHAETRDVFCDCVDPP